MIQRTLHRNSCLQLLKQFPVVAIMGARQVGKTTLAQQIMSCFEGTVTFFDLEDPIDLNRLTEPIMTLRRLKGLIVLDEIQRAPELFPILRVLADRRDQSACFLILGSASPHLMKQSSESLAGRVAYYELKGFSLDELDPSDLQQLWNRGSFPRAFLAESLQQSVKWRQEFIRTFLERDIPQLGISIPAITLRRFWTMLAHYHGNILNSSELARSFGVADTTIRRYLDILHATYVVRILPPWHENLKKRQVKSPKIYIADSGILHTLLHIHETEELLSHPKVGASWEGFALETVVLFFKIQSEECYFWSTHRGAELDLFLNRGTRRIGIEFKFSEMPSVTKSMLSAIESLNLDFLYVIHRGEHVIQLGNSIYAVPLTAIDQIDTI